MQDATGRQITAALIVAAGRGTRAGGDRPKQWQMLAGQSLAARSVAAFARHPDIDRVMIVLHPDDLAAGLWDDPAVPAVAGGATRAASVRAGLEALAGTADRVLIHDAARPMVSAALIGRVVAALAGHDGAAPALAVTDALWRGAGGMVSGTLPRDGLYRAQTPQGFHLPAILAAHRAAHRAADGAAGGAAEGIAGEAGAADDVAIACAHGLRVAIVAGEEANRKITLPGDLAQAEDSIRQQGGAPMDIRLGNGYDVHAFCPGDHVMLCGVRVPHGRGLLGHSDADVGMHALTDAIYGALAEGDIGRHFPPSDPQWRGAASAVFLAHAAGLAAARGYVLSNADVTLVCERPKIGPHALDMQRELARIMGVAADRVSVKATTSERLGFTGREEGIAALATATLVRP